MTLSPVFRSTEALEVLTSKGYLDTLTPSTEAQRAYVRKVRDLLPDVIDPRYIGDGDTNGDDVAFLQENFFLILFDSVFRTLGCPPERLVTYGMLNLCLKGMVVSGDNLFDEEAKMDLPLGLGRGHRFRSIMQLLCFDQLIVRILETRGDVFTSEEIARFRRDVVSSLAAIGTLEGSEEAGVDEILPLEATIDRVHRLRGGELFALAFIAPRVWEPRSEQPRWETARRGIARLGTAFQIVDDLTDFEFDLRRRSHNALAARIVHEGTQEERAAWQALGRSSDPQAGLVESRFRASARAILDRARLEAERGFEELASVGFWFPPQDAELFIRSIAGDAGDERVHAVTERSPVR